MTQTITDLVIYHQRSPNLMVDGCLNSGLDEEGIEFRGFDPEYGDRTFIGRTSLIEAMGLIFGLTPNQVVDRLTREKTMVTNLQLENERLSGRNTSLEALLDSIAEIAATRPPED